MAKSTDLCTLAELKGWVGQTSTDDDATLARLISGASGDIMSYLNRSSLQEKTYTQIFNRIGKNGKLMLLNFPVLAVASVTANGTAIPAAATPGLNVVPNSGWLLDVWDGLPPGAPQSLNFIDSAPYVIGFQGLAVTYSAGYVVSAEAQTVPDAANAASKYLVNVTAPYGPWSANSGVTYADGTAMTLVASAPTAAGEYQLGSLPGQYIFNVADADEDILISYSYTPSAINQACIEIAAERWKYKTRIGESSQTIQGQRTASYRNDAMTPYVKDLLNNFRRVTPYG